MTSKSTRWILVVVLEILVLSLGPPARTRDREPERSFNLKAHVPCPGLLAGTSFWNKQTSVTDDSSAAIPFLETLFDASIGRPGV